MPLTLTTLPISFLSANQPPSPPVPAELLARVRRLAIENWGEVLQGKRESLAVLLRAELTFQAGREFGLSPGPDVRPSSPPRGHSVTVG